jgi:hypothetical protein
MVDVARIEAMLDDSEKALYACGQTMAAGVVRAKFSATVPMIYIEGGKLEPEAFVSLTIPNYDGSINT